MMFPTSASVVIALLMGIVGGAFVIWELRRVLGYDQGNEAMQAIAKAIQEGSAAFFVARISGHRDFRSHCRHGYFPVFTVADRALFRGGGDCVGRRGLLGDVCGGSRQRPNCGSGGPQSA